MSFLDNFKEGTGIKLAAQGAQVAWATGQAIHANIKYKEKMTDIENFQRQEIINPFQNLSNPYANLQVATKAAEMQAEQSDIALANTLDSLRETGAGGATALAQAALKSKQGVSASIQQQETQNQKLQAQGQLQVDIAKGKGESWRTGMQERREIQELDRMQGQADLLRAQQLYSTQAAVAGLGAMGETLGSGMLPPQIPETSQTTEQSTSQANKIAAENAQQAMQDLLRVGQVGQVGYAQPGGRTTLYRQNPLEAVMGEDLTRDLYSNAGLSAYTIRNEAKARLGSNWRNDPAAAQAQQWINLYQPK
jgi:hypothetical protein